MHVKANFFWAKNRQESRFSYRQVAHLPFAKPGYVWPQQLSVLFCPNASHRPPSLVSGPIRLRSEQEELLPGLRSSDSATFKPAVVEHGCRNSRSSIPQRSLIELASDVIELTGPAGSGAAGSSGETHRISTDLGQC